MRAILIAALLSLSVPAFGQDFDATLDAAMEAYKANRFLEAAESFEAAYALDPQPELVYNRARSYEKALERDKAITAYERFLGLSGTTAVLRTKALESLAALRREKAAEAQAEAAKTAPPTASAPTPSSAGQLRTAPQPSAPVAEWVLVGTGAAALAAGGVFGILALDSESQLDDAKARNAGVDELTSLSNDTERNALVADILFGVGGATLLTGAIFLLTRSDDGDAQVLAPTLTEDGASLTWSGRF